MRVLIRDDGSGYGQIAGARTFRDVAERSRQRWAQNQQRAEQMRRMQDYRRRLAAWDDRPAPEAPAPLAPAPARPAPWQIAAQDNPDVPRWYEAIADFGPAMRAMRDRGLDLMRRDTERRDNAWAAGRQAEQQQQALAPYVSSALGWRAGTMEATSAARDDDAWWAQRVAADRARNVADIAERRDAEDAAVLSSPALMQSILERWRGQMLSAIDNPPPVEVAPATAPRISGWGLEVPRPDTGAPGITSSATVAGQTISPPATPLLPTRPLPPVPIDSFTGRPMSLGAGPGDPEAAPWWLQGQAREIQNKIETRNARINDPNYFKWAGDNRFFRELGANISNEADQVFTYFQQAAGAIPIGNLPKLWGGQPIYPDMTIAQGVYPMLGVLNRAFNPFYTALRRPGALPTPWELAGPARPGETPWAYAERALNLADPGPDLDRFARRNAYLASLPPEIRAIRGMEVAADVSGIGARAAAGKLINDKMYSDIWHDKAIAAMLSGHDDIAARYYAYATYLDNTSYSDLIHLNDNPWAIAVEGAIFDITNLIPFGALGKVVKNIRAENIPLALGNIDEAMKLGAREAEQILQGQAANVAVRGFSWVDTAPFIGKTADAKAHVDRDIVFGAFARLLSGVESTEQARLLLDAFFKEPGKLFTGVKAIDPDLIAAAGEGGIKFGAQSFANTQLLDRSWLVQMVKDKVPDFRTLKGTGFNAVDFFAELDTELYRAARERYGLAALDLPDDAVTYNLVKQADGTYRMVYLNEDGKEVFESAPMAEAEALAYRLNLDKAVKAGQSGTIMKTLHAITGVQREVLSTMFLALRPGHWIRNAAAATATLVADDLYSLRSTANVIGDLARKGVPVPSPRMGEGLFPKQFGVGAAAEGMTGGVRERAAWNIYGKAKDFGNQVWTGNIELLGRVPFGEQAFYTKAYAKSFERGFRTLWQSVVKHDILPQFSGLGLTPEQIQPLLDLITDVGIYGSRADVARAVRNAVTRGYTPFSLRSLGIPDELIEPDFQRTLTKAVNDWLGSDNPLSQESLAAIHRTINETFDAARAQPLRTIQQAPPQVGVYTDSSKVAAEDAAEVIDTLTDEARRAGISYKQVQPQLQEFAAQVTAQMQATGNTIVQEIRALPPDDRSHVNIIFDAWARIGDMRDEARRAVDNLSETAVAASQSADRAQAQAAWNKKWEETRRIYDDLATAEQQVLAEMREDFARVSNGETFAPRYRYQDAMDRYLDADMQAIEEARKVETGAATDPAERQKFQTVIKANRAFTDLSRTTLYGAFARYPSPVALDIVVQTERQSADIGSMAAAHLAPLRAQARKARTAEGWAAYFAERNKTWREAADSTHTLYLNASRLIVLSGESEKIAAAVRWSANGVDYILEAPLGAGKWQAYRLTDGRRLVVGAGEKIAVPEQQARAYYTVTQQVEAEVDAVMDSIIAETAAAASAPAAAPGPARTGPAMWRHADVDEPVVVTGVMGEQNGVRYYSIEGSNTGVPEHELIFDSVSPSLSPGAGGAVGAPSAPDEEPVDEAAAILRRIMDADEPMTQEEFVALAQRRAELDPTAPRYEPLPAGDVDLGMTPTPAVPPAPPPMTDAHRRRLHALGRELHGKGWDDVRPTMAEEVSNGRTTHTAMLTGPEADELIRRLEELKRSRKPVAPPPPKSASRESIAAEARKAFKLKPQQIADYMAVLDARAETWAEQTGRKVEEYYSSTFAEIKRTKLTTEGALRQEGITYAPKKKRTGGPILDTRGMGKPGKKQTGSEPNYLITYPEASQRPQWRNTLGTPGPETLPPRDPNAQPFLYQKTSEIARGEVQFLDDGRAVIHAFRSADFSTLVHETFHVFRRDLARVAKVNQQAAKDLAALEKAAGVVGGKWTREAEELVAGWGERYMMEGVAPTPALEGPFSRLKKWLTNIYRRVAAQDQPGADLSPEVRQVFDRMLGAQEAPVRLADDVAVSAPTRAPEAPVAPVESPWRAGQRVTARRATGQTVTGVITDERPELGGVRIRTDDGRLVSVPQANVTPLQEAPWQPIPRRPVTSGEPMPRPGQPSRSPLTPRQRVTVETPAGPVEGEIVEATAKQVTIATDNGMTVKVNPENVAPVEGAIPAEVPTVASQQTPAPAQVAPAPAPASTVVKLGDGRWEWRTTNLNGETVEGIATTRKAAQQRVAIWSQTKIAPPSTFSATTPTPAPSVLDELAARVDDGDAGAVQEYAAKRFTEGPPSQSVDISTAVTEPVLDVPAPVRVQQPAPGIVGRTTQAWSDPAHPYTMRYEVVEYDSLVPSNLPDGRVNPRYPAELQPRDRTQAASQAQVQKMAQQLAPAELLADTNAIDRGSPVVGLTNAVESGNGRMMAFGLATQETINKYKAALLDAADSFGLPREAIEQMQKPVLVRRRMDGDAIDFAREANARVTLGMNAVETGKQLAQQLTPGDLSRLAEAGGANALMLKQTLSQQGAMEFIRRLIALVPPAERAALVGPDGSLTSQAVDLIRSSLFSVVFEDDAFLRNYVLAATPDLRNIGNGVEQAIAKLAFLQKSNPELAIGDAISEAAMTLARLRDEGTSVAQHLSQMGMFGQMSDEAALLLRYFDTNMRSGKAIADLLNEYADAALRFNANQAVMFAEAATPSRAELLQRAIDAVADGVSSQQTKLFQPAKETFDTPAWKRWFRNSVVRNEDGTPRPMYHGTPVAGFDSFDPARANVNGLYGPGFYFTDNPQVAGGYVGYTFNTYGMGEESTEEAARLAAEQEFAKIKARPGTEGGNLHYKVTRLGDDVYKWVVKGEYPYITKKGYAQQSVRSGEPTQGTYQVYLSIQNPFDIDARYTEADILRLFGDNAKTRKIIDTLKTYNLFFDSSEKSNDLFVQYPDGTVSGQLLYDLLWAEDRHTLRHRTLQAAGFDGITHIGGKNTGTPPHRVYIAFEPTQIKSALANRGTYDPTTPNILYQSARRRSTGIDWFGLGRTQNAARDLWEWTKKHWRYGMQTPTMGDVGAHQVRSLDDAQRKLMEALPGLAARRTPNTLSVAQRQGVLKVLTDTIAPRFDDAVFGAQGIAQRNADGSMLNYRDRRGFDTALGLLFPYHFFWSRSAKNWLKRSLEHPAMLNLYYEQEKAIQTENRQAGVPTRLKGTVPLWTRSDGSQVRIQNPLHYALPFNMYFPGSVYNDPAEAESEAERWLMRIRNYTPGLFPLWSWLLDKTLDSYSPLPGGEKRTDSYFTGSYFPVAGISALASQALRSGPGMAQWATGPYQPYRVARAIALIAKRDGLNPNLIGWAQQIALNVDRGRPLYENVEKAYRKEAYDLYIQGKQEAARDRLAQSGVGYATGTNAYIWRPEEPQLAQASRQYSQAGYNPRTQPMGSKAAQQEVMQGEPYLPGWWNKSNLLPQGQRPWEPTPGQSSTVSMLYEQQEPIYAAMAKAVADYLTQNPDATRADITAIKEPFYARLGPLKERLQGIPQRGTSLKGMNPTERALYEIEKLYGYEPPNKPQPPGEGAAPATLQAYYANLAAWEDARLRRIDANLRQLMAEEPSYPEEWRSLLPVLLGGRYTANLLETYEQRPMSPVEAAWDSRLTFAREITAQEWATRKQQVAHLVGPQAVALFEQYLSTPTGPERQALKESNPLYGAAIEAAFNPREYAQGVATWGPAWYQIATGAPKHPGDGASEAQLQQYYNAMDAYRERNPLYDAIKLWYRGRPNAQVANLPDGAYIPNDYGKDYQQAISIFGADIFALRQQRSEAYAKSKETGYAWDDAHQPELKRIKGYGVWYNEEAKQPPTLAQEQQIVIPDVNAYRGPRPVGTDLPPLGADLPAPGNRGILPPQTVTAPATAPEAPQGSTTPPQAQTPATAPQTGAAGPFGLPAAPATQNAPVAPAAGEITQAFEEGRLYLPFDGQRAAVQGYGENPQNYARFGLDGHEGMDWMMPEGTPIYAAAAGTVETVAYSPSGYGNYVVIRHEDGSQTLYAHFQQATVQVGDEVTPSDQIGLSGNTGNSTGPHLHFGYRPPGADLQDGMRGWVDPSGILVGREGEAPQPGVQWDLVNQYANQDVRYVASQAKRKVWEQRKQAVAQQFGAEIAGYFQQYLDLPEGAARQDFKAQHPELRAVNLFTFQPQVWAQATKIFTPDIIMAWAKAPAWGESEAAQERRKQYFVQNPGAWEFGAWLNGRPTSDDEGDIGSEADDWKYNAGRDYNTAKKRFGEDIWELAKQYRSADQATRRSLRGQFPQIMAFFDWWYGNLPQRQDAVASSGRLRVGRNPHYVRRSYGGSSGYGGYARTPRIYPTDARELQRDLWYGPERADRPWAPEPLDTRGFEIRTLQQRLQDWEAPTPPDDLRLPRAPEEARRLFRGR